MWHLVLSSLMLLAALPVAAQTPVPPRSLPVTSTTNTPRTPDGRPDLQGIWKNATMTPLERPKPFEDKAFFTEAEDPVFQKAVLEAILALIGEEDLKTSGEADFLEPGNLLPDRRTSLIIDPANGKIPPLLPDAQRRLEASRARTKNHPADGPEDFNAAERCLIATNQASPPMLPQPYNAHIQIVQTPEYVVILTEMIHDARIIPLDRRPPLSPVTRQWKGDSRGRWEGDTLVVDTTHFAAKGTYSRFDWLNPSDEALHVIERFKWLSEDTLSYQFTVDDPTVYTKAWTAELPLSRTNEQMFEFACHEGNYSLRNSLSGARAVER